MISTTDALLGIEACAIFFDGTFSEPQLDHPECVAVAPDGAVWCGGERGQVFRLEPDGSGLEQVASTGGFCLGLAFDGDRLLVCDVKRKEVLQVDTRTGAVEPFAGGTAERPLTWPNYAVVDGHGRVYVSDTTQPGERGPGIYRFAPDGSGELWHAGPFASANGLALAPDGAHLYIAETNASAISRIAIEPGGGPGERELVARVDGLPDGLAFDGDGLLYVGCYEPSQVLRIDADGTVRTLVRDHTARTLCHPTNLAFRDRTLFVANLGRCHVTRIEL